MDKFIQDNRNAIIAGLIALLIGVCITLGVILGRGQAAHTPIDNTLLSLIEKRKELYEKGKQLDTQRVQTKASFDSLTKAFEDNDKEQDTLDRVIKGTIEKKIVSKDTSNETLIENK